MWRTIFVLGVALAGLAMQQPEPSGDLGNRIANLEYRQNTIETSIRETKDSFQFFLTLTLAIVSLFYGLTTFMQYRRDLREQTENQDKMKLLTEQNNRYESYITRQEQNNRQLLDSTKQNIDQVTQLIESLDSMFKVVAKADEIEKSLTDLDREMRVQKEQQKEYTMELLRELNTDAIEICGGMNRDNYMSLENQQRLRNFRNKLNARFTEIGKFENKLNANCFLILGLDFRIRNLFDEALENLEIAVRRAKLYSKQDGGPLMHPDPSKNEEEIRMWNKKLANIALFHKALILYNLGKHRDAENMFREALEYDPNDIQAMIYIPEGKYLGHYAGFEEIVKEFERLINLLEDNRDFRGNRLSKDILLSQLYVRYGNCYFPGSTHKPFAKQENLKVAEEIYAQAYQQLPDSYLTKFSYAQALAEKTRRRIPEVERLEAEKLARQLFSEAYAIVKVKIGETTETKILLMLYYILLICCQELDLGSDKIARFISKIYEKGAELPSIEGYRIYSPLTKNDLTYEELKQEIQVFENSSERIFV